MFKFAQFVLTLMIILVMMITKVKSELFTAIVEMESLVKTEQQLLRVLDDYIQLEQSRLDKLRRLRTRYEQIQQAAEKDTVQYLSNPINSFQLVKSLTLDWKQAQQLMLNESCQLGNQFHQHLDRWMQNQQDIKALPSSEDLSGAADALLRLQKTYRLDTTMLANGNIEISSDQVLKASQSLDTKFIPSSDPSSTASINKEQSTFGSATFSQSLTNESKRRNQLSSSDCFEIGKQAYTTNDNERTIRWMQEALDRLSIDPQPAFTKAEALEYLAFATYKSGNVRQALHLTNELLKLDPQHSRAMRNLHYYQQELHAEDQAARKRGDDDDEDIPQDPLLIEQPPGTEPSEKNQRDVYEALCRGEHFISKQTLSKLSCSYLTRPDQPYLQLQRIQIEQVYLRPYAVLYHNVISDHEIEEIKRLARPRLQRATVQNYRTGQLETVDYRISKSGWLRDADHELVRRFSQRIERLTGLTIETAEELQVVNYGLGGHYEPHYDFARREEKHAFRSLGTGNRIATWLTYLSDVEAGGATVFPILGFGVKPQKGSALFWYNLHRNGEGDLLTRHAACPVLIGSKWVANKWFHERGQEFRRPCALRIND